MTTLSHVDEDGQASMVDITDKPDTERIAVASGQIRLAAETVAMIVSGEAPKGDVIATARIAGIMAAKRTSDLIPLCHPLALTNVKVEIAPLDDNAGFAIEATAKVRGPTGVEMEALTAVTVAALTLYDMIKAVDREAVIGEIKLVSKSGGESGVYERDGGQGDEAKEKPKLVSRGFRRSPSALVARTRALDPATPTGAAAVSRVEACRQFMRDNKLQVTAWASLAGLPPGLVYGFLHGRVGRLPKDSEERLARAASATVRDVFGTE